MQAGNFALKVSLNRQKYTRRTGTKFFTLRINKASYALKFAELVPSRLSSSFAIIELQKPHCLSNGLSTRERHQMLVFFQMSSVDLVGTLAQMFAE